MEGIQFFGKVDRNKEGKIASEVPAWTMETHLDDLTEGIERKERTIQRGEVPQSELPFAVAELEKSKARYDAIMESKPKFAPKDKDIIAKEYKRLGDEIKDSMFSDSDMRSGKADPHEEARRMVNPIITVNPALAAACGIKIQNGRMSRNDAVRMYKIIGKSLGDNGNAERLRRS